MRLSTTPLPALILGLALAAALPGEVAVHTIEAPIGHDGFLTEIGQLNSQLRQSFFG